MQAFIQYSRQFSMPITQLSSMANTIQLTIASAERVFELLDEAEEPADPVPATDASPAPTGDVEIDHMSFSYKPDAPLIEDMSIDVQPGQMVAIVGHTGAGKTTLVNLLMRFYDINAGAIRIDGVDIREMTRGGLRRIFGMVLQDTWLFSGTIRDNIAYGREDATEDEIVRAAKAAQADHFIRTLPENYDTMINEEATNLSQGQKQLLTIARAFLADPAILILDEATSSVDTRTEVLIQKAMAQLMHGRTTFVIAHRLSTIRNADLILMMEHGRIVEKGTHDELLAANGRYADLYRSQFSNRVEASLSSPDEAGLKTRLLFHRCKRRAGHRVAPEQRDAAAVVLHVDERPRQLIDGVRQLVELHRHAHHVLVGRVAVRAPQRGLVVRDRTCPARPSSK